MPLTIDASVGGHAANSFVTEAEAIAFAATRLNLVGWTTVAGATCTENEKKALIEATRQLSALIYPGYRTDNDQTLSWPRYVAPNPDAGSNFFSVYYDSNILPQRLKDGTCELAFEFLKAGTTDIAAHDATLDVIMKKVDVLETQYATPSQRAQGLSRFPRVMQKIGPLLMIASGQVRLTR